MFGKRQKQQLADQEQLIQQQQAQWAAINRVMAVIEFDLQGRILTANQNFLQLMGYRLDELVGQHHRLFVDAQTAASSDYHQFWQRLNNGECLADRYPRVTKSGRCVWIEASYNPVFDKHNRPVKIVKFATNITSRVEAEFDAKGRLDAINRAMAVIEFDLEGKILAVNDNFLQVMGYSRQEVVGHHHRMFVESSYAQSSEYPRFWNRLARGEYFARTYKRVAKGGRIVWIEATYNPIFGSDGKPVKVVKYAMDVSANPNTRLLKNVVQDAVDLLEAVAKGDLTRDFQQEYRDYELTMFYPLVLQLQAAIQQMLQSLQSSVGEASKVSHTVRDVAQSVSGNAEQLRLGMKSQLSALQTMASQMQAMNHSVQTNTQTSQEVAVMARNMQQQTKEGMSVMQQTINAMQAMSASSTQIVDIVAMIDAISFQTNLLALNAAVEAARAGEHGRGFAVVAGEVRELANKSANAAKDIRQLIGDSLARIQTGTRLADQSGDMLDAINHHITQVAEKVDQIAQSSTVQSDVIQQVSYSVNQVERITEANNEQVRSANAAAESLSKEADTLHSNMSYFKLI